MKKLCAWLLALCMLCSSALAEMQFGTEEMLAEILEGIAQCGAFWVDYADDALKLMGGLVLDKDGLPGAGARYVTAQKDLYAAADATGVRYSDGQQTLNATWEELTGTSAAASPQLTEADGELLGMMCGEILSAVMEVAQVENTAAQLDGQSGQCTQIQLPLRDMGAALDKSVADTLSKYRTQLGDVLTRNAAYLSSIGLPGLSVDQLLSGWQQLGVSNLIPEGIAAQIRWTQAGSCWKLEASAMGAGVDVHFDGSHVDGRVYMGEQEWPFDSRDLQTVLGWMQDLLWQISPDALDFSFSSTRRETRLHAKLDSSKFLSQLSSGIQTVLTRNSARAQEILDRYGPVAELLGARISGGMTVENVISQLQTELQQAIAMWRSRNAGMFGYTNPVLEADFSMADGAFSLLLKSPWVNVDAALDESGVDLDAELILRRRVYAFTAHGLWNDDSLQLNGTIAYNGDVHTRWALSGVMENSARIFTLNANNQWIGTLTLRDGSAELSAMNGILASALWGRSSASVHFEQGEEVVDASFRLTGGQFTANATASAFDASLLLREESGGGRVRFQLETPRGKNYISSFSAEGALTDEQILLKAGRWMKSRGQEYADWEVGVDLRPGRAGGTLYTRDTQASFQWTTGTLSAQCLYLMAGLTVDSRLLVTDITTPGTADYNTTQIDWSQKLHYRDGDTIDNSRSYTVHAIAGDMALHFDIVDQDGKHASANFTLFEQPAELMQLLGLEGNPPQPAPAPAAEPEPTKAPSGGGSFIGGPRK